MHSGSGRSMASAAVLKWRNMGRGGNLKREVLHIICGLVYMTYLCSAWGILKNGAWETIRFVEAEETAGEQKGMMPDVHQEENSGNEENEENKEGYEEERKKIALTFDDGPRPQTTPVLLDGLEERGVKATFFVIGEYAKQYPEIVKREDAEGHIVGNHTWSHVEITQISEEKARKEIMDTSDLVEEITGKPTAFMRPPFGSWQKELEMELHVMPVLWNVDPLDWTTENEEEIVNKVVTDVKENDIILLHDCYSSSVNAALRIIDILQKEGYEFVTVDELLLD